MCLCPSARYLVSNASLTRVHQGGIGRGKFNNLFKVLIRCVLGQEHPYVMLVIIYYHYHYSMEHAPAEVHIG